MPASPVAPRTSPCGSGVGAIGVSPYEKSSTTAKLPEAEIRTLVIGVFSLYMLYDLKRIIDGGETNYISATLALYLDLFNVFQGLLALLGLGGSSD